MLKCMTKWKDLALNLIYNINTYANFSYLYGAWPFPPTKGVGYLAHEAAPCAMKPEDYEVHHLITGCLFTIRNMLITEPPYLK